MVDGHQRHCAPVCAGGSETGVPDREALDAMARGTMKTMAVGITQFLPLCTTAERCPSQSVRPYERLGRWISEYHSLLSE